MQDIKSFQENLKILRKEYTFPEDKDRTFDQEKKVRKLMARKTLKDMDGIKEFIGELNKKIEDMSVLLAMDPDMTAEERAKIFSERKAYIWVAGFFIEPEKIINNIINTVQSEVKVLDEKLNL